MMMAAAVAVAEIGMGVRATVGVGMHGGAVAMAVAGERGVVEGGVHSDLGAW
jgi:hypothetical protein